MNVVNGQRLRLLTPEGDLIDVTVDGSATAHSHATLLELRKNYEKIEGGNARLLAMLEKSDARLLDMTEKRNAALNELIQLKKKFEAVEGGLNTARNSIDLAKIDLLRAFDGE